MPPDKDGPERLPPQSREAERSVLGSMLRDNAVIGDVVQLIRTEDFYADAHQKVFQAIIDLHDKGGQPVDVVILAEELKQRDQIADVGGYAYLAELWDAAPTAANAEYYARIVREKALVRNLIHASTEVLRDAYGQTMPAEELIESAERKIFDVLERGITGNLYTLEQAIEETYDRIDKRTSGQQMEFSGLATGFADLDEITAGLQKSELVIIAARPSVGKCLSHDAEIVLADGSVATIEEVYRRRAGHLLTLDEDWQFRWTTPSAFVDDGLKPVYRVTTRLGRQVQATLSHPFLTIGGWRPLAELRPGERVAVPRAVPVFGEARLRDGEVKLLGYLLGDGNLTNSSPRFTNGNPRLRADFAGAVAELAGLKVRVEKTRQPRTTSVRVAGDEAFIAEHRADFGMRLRAAIRTRYATDKAFARALGVSRALVCLWCQGACAPNPQAFAALCSLLEVAPADLAPHGLAAIRRSGKNPLALWLEDLGLAGKDAHEKQVPAVVFRLARPQMALFLNRLFATDGWASVSADGAAQLGYSTVSERLARQVQHLLLRFGVIASLRRRAVKYKGTRRPSWQLDVTDPAAIQTFAAEVGMFGKEDDLARVLRQIAARCRSKPNRDRLPLGVWEQLDGARHGEPWAAVARRAGLGRDCTLRPGRRGLTRDRLARLAKALGHEPLQRLASSAVYWDAIVSIEPVGAKPVYDLTIPTTHNFVANDVCVHNTAFALNLTRNVVIGEKQPVFFVSLEQSRIELAERLLCCQARVDSHRLRKGDLRAEDMEKLIEAGGVLRNARLFIDDTPAQGMLRISANARRLKHRQGIKLVVIDYLQLIEPENRRDPRQEQVAQISRRLKFLARELEVPVVALAQVNRASEDRQDHRPRLSDLRESGSLEQDADTVLLLHRPDRYEPGQHEGVIEVIVGKQRNGPTGEVTLAYIKQFMRYEDFSPGTPFDG